MLKKILPQTTSHSHWHHWSLKECISDQFKGPVTYDISLEAWTTSFIFSGFLGFLKVSFFFIHLQSHDRKSLCWTHCLCPEISISLVLEVSEPWLGTSASYLLPRTNWEAFGILSLMKRNLLNASLALLQAMLHFLKCISISFQYIQ